MKGIVIPKSYYVQFNMPINMSLQNQLHPFLLQKSFTTAILLKNIHNLGLLKMPVDPRSELPVRIAKAISDALGIKLNPSQFYSHDNSDPGVFHSSIRRDLDHKEDGQYLFHNRRVTCFNLLQAPSNAASGAIPLQTDFNQEKNMQIFARCAIHEVHESPDHDFEGQSNPVFNASDLGWRKKVGLEITLDTTSPIYGKTQPNGNFVVFDGSVGLAAKFEPGVAQYDTREHGTKLVNFARDHVLENYTPPANTLTPAPNQP